MPSLRLTGRSKLPLSAAGPSCAVTIDGHALEGTWSDHRAQGACAALRRLLPLRAKLIHARWSGEACWVPLAPRLVNFEPENETGTPSPGEILLYAGELSEPELLVPYGCTRFASAAGPLAGSPVIRIHGDLDMLGAIGRRVLWRGAVEMVIE